MALKAKPELSAVCDKDAVPIEILEMFDHQGRTVLVRLETSASKWLTARAYYTEGWPVNDIPYLVHQQDRAYWSTQDEEDPVNSLVQEARFDIENEA